MRIVAGTVKGRRLVVPRGDSTRPTSDKVRAAIFNILGQFFEGGEVLDLYAGTGAMALEALSRGFTRATCVDSDRHAVKAIEANAAACGFASRLVLERGSVTSTLAKLARSPARFDLAFVDPPYSDGPEAALAFLAPVLVPGARVVAEHAAKRQLEARYGRLAQVDSRHFSDTGVTIFVLQ